MPNVQIGKSSVKKNLAVKKEVKLNHNAKTEYYEIYEVIPNIMQKKLGLKKTKPSLSTNII